MNDNRSENFKALLQMGTAGTFIAQQIGKGAQEEQKLEFLLVPFVPLVFRSLASNPHAAFG